jgi:hypothetical protein
VTIRTKTGAVDEGEAVPPSQAAALRVALIGSLCLAALAITHFLFHSVLLTDALLRWVLY